jgi:hypothetical protein
MNACLMPGCEQPGDDGEFAGACSFDHLVAVNLLGQEVQAKKAKKRKDAPLDPTSDTPLARSILGLAERPALPRPIAPTGPVSDGGSQPGMSADAYTPPGRHSTRAMRAAQQRERDLEAGLVESDRPMSRVEMQSRRQELVAYFKKRVPHVYRGDSVRCQGWIEFEVQKAMGNVASAPDWTRVGEEGWDGDSNLAPNSVEFLDQNGRPTRWAHPDRPWENSNADDSEMVDGSGWFR